MAERLYVVENQVPTRQQIAGQLVDVNEVHYLGPNGIRGWVRVPVATMSDELVDELIRAQLGAKLRIAQLGEQPG